VPTALLEVSGGVVPNTCEVNAYQRDDTRAKVLARRMRERDNWRLANCDRGAEGQKSGVRSQESGVRRVASEQINRFNPGNGI
jgi:hypothetical protein